MDRNADAARLNWLNDNAGEIIRWRLLRDFSFPLDRQTATALLR